MHGTFGKLLIRGIFLSLFLFSIMGAHARAQSESANVHVEIGVGDTILQIDGKTSPLSTVNFLENSAVIGTINSDALGNFSKTFTAQEAGIRNISIYAITSSHGTTDTITFNINVVKHSTTTLNVFLPATINLSSTNVDQGQSITLSGQGYPNSTVILTLDSNQNFNIPTDINGVWEFVLDTTPLSGGNHSIVLVVQDALANISSPSSARNFVVNVEEEAEDDILPILAGLLPPIVGPASGLHLVVSIPIILLAINFLNFFNAALELGLSLLDYPLRLILSLTLFVLLAYFVKWLLIRRDAKHAFTGKTGN